MLDRPETRYARSGDVHLAYQVVGEHPRTLVYIPGLLTHVEQVWEWPPYAAFLRRLASFRRLVIFDKRGFGASDRGVAMPTLEQQLDDIIAVMDAVGVESADVFAAQDSAVMAFGLAASHPERVEALIAYGAVARFLRADDYPWGISPEVFESILQVVQETWGQDDSPNLRYLAPSIADDAACTRWHRRFQRLAASPGLITDLLRLWSQIDVRPLLGSIRAPVLLLQRDQAFNDIAHGRYLAQALPHARLVELPGNDEVLWAGDTDVIVEETELFLTGRRSVNASDRAFATVLFTDLVGSTERAAELGDTRWREILDRHDRIAADALRDFRGRFVKSTGDGLLAIFDGPARAVRCAGLLRQALAGLDVQLRVGLHSGEIELRGDDIGGLTVHIASRIQGQAQPGEILLSRATAQLLAGEELPLVPRGGHELRGLPGTWELLALA